MSISTVAFHIAFTPAVVSDHSSSGWEIWTLIGTLIVLLLIGWITLLPAFNRFTTWRSALGIVGMAIITFSIVLLAYVPGQELASLMCRSKFAPIWAGMIGLACVSFGRGFARLAALSSGVVATGLWYIIALSLR